MVPLEAGSARASEVARQGGLARQQKAREQRELAILTEREVRSRLLSSRSIPDALSYLGQVVEGSVKPDPHRLKACTWVLDQAMGKAKERVEEISDHADALRAMANAATLQARAKLAEVELEKLRLGVEAGEVIDGEGTDVDTC